MTTPAYTLLIVEDIPAVREVYGYYLMADPICEYSLLEAQSIAEGLELCHTRSIDAILLDYALPDGNGLEFLAALSGQRKGSIPPVVMITGRGNESIAAQAIKLGAEDYLVKPKFTQELLQKTVRSAIDNARLRLQVRHSNEQKFRAIFDRAFELMGIVSLDGVLLEVNQTALASISATESEIIGSSFWEAPWWHTEQLRQQLREAIATAASGQFVRYEVEFANGSGALTITDFSLKPVLDEAGRVTVLIAEVRDITEHKQIQAALEARIQELDRAAAILNERNRELDAFVYVVAHDLKAPLRAISNLSQWIEDDLAGVVLADTQPQMTLLRSRVERMSAMIDGLLDYARIGTTDAKIEPVIVAELLAEVIDSIDPPPTFTISISPNLPTLDTNWLLLFQVFSNLIGNAVKHHDRADGLIEISGQARGDFYEFAVTDDGAGIHPEHHERVFEIFKVVNPQRSDSTGIGLAIVKKIIEAEGGTIRLESQIGQGTTFYFTLPMSRLALLT